MTTEKEFQEYCNKLNDSFDLNDENRAELLRSFNLFAKSNKKEIIFLINNLEPKKGELLYHIYDSFIKDLKEWEDFLISELKRLFDASEISKDYKSIFAGLEGFELINAEKDKEFFERIRKELLRRTNSSKLPIKRKAIWMLGDFLFKENIQSITRLKELSMDKDWKSRSLAQMALNDLNNIELYSNLSLVDKFRCKFGNVYEF